MNHPLTSSVLAAVLAVAFAPTSAAQVTEYCFGNSCPCGNDDPSAGCGNAGFDGSSSTGALLQIIGSPLDPDLALSGMQGGQFGLIYMGGAGIDFPFGDGKRCVGDGGIGIHRFPLRTSGAFGDFLELDIVGTSQSFPGGGAISAGNTYYFQGWYRDPGGPCGGQFNLTNAISISFPAPPDVSAPQLAGRSLGEYPWFDYTVSINQGDPVEVAVDPIVYPGSAGPADIYVVNAKTAAQWDGDPSLTDVSFDGANTVTITGSSITADTFVADIGALPGTAGTDTGIGYDIVVDINQNGVYDPGTDLIDGYGAEPGFYCIRDLAGAGPYTTVETIYSGGTWLGQDLYYPSNISSLNDVPIIVVSHGNGHNYQWYDHFGEHMSSYGYVVMSHTNQTGPGIETASTTTLTNTDYLLDNLSTIAGGALQGRVDTNTIIWIGHSRGGEGVARAYDRLFDGTYTPANFDIDDIKLVSSIAPTDFLGAGSANPHGVDYHLWTGSADADVNGSPGCDICQTYHLLERATGRRASFTLQGGGHAVFHDGGGSLVASGPCLVSRPAGHPTIVAHFLSLVRYMVEDDQAAKDSLWRQYETYKPVGASSDPCVIVNLELKESITSGTFVIDDYQTNNGTGLSSSGTTVSFNVTALTEGLLNDNNTSFTDLASDPMNGMTRMRGGESTRGVVFEWSSPAFYEIDVAPTFQDVSNNGYLSFRACQVTRDALTTAAIGDVTFDVVLRDGNGVTSSINIGAYGGGIEEPYQRTGSGSGVGWGNEFETIRIRVNDFIADGSGLDLTDIEAVRFEFGGAGASSVGRIGLDDVEFTAN